MFRYAKEVSKYLLEIQNGNLTVFRKLYDMTAMHLFGVAKIYLVNKNLAEDVVSITFIKAMKYISSYDTQQDGYNWLCRIAQNIARTINKKELNRSEAERRFTNELETEYVEKGFDDVDFFMLIDQLQEPDREIAYQRFYEGKTFQEIGKNFNITRAAVYQKVRKICKFIENNFKNQ